MSTRRHKALLAKADEPQAKSRLLNLPAELRKDIWTYVLRDYMDPAPKAQYRKNTCYTRPSHYSPRKSDTRLLRTCRAVYRETWFMPFSLRKQCIWLCNDQRAPREWRSGRRRLKLHRAIKRMSRLNEPGLVDIEALHFFSQMYKVEQDEFNICLDALDFRPREVILTIRDTDWWFWESDEVLKFAGGWTRNVVPECVGIIRIELESLRRKKGQVDAIAAQMVRKWSFQRQDGLKLFADETGKSNEVGEWRGSSKGQGKRWTRDESEKGFIDYYLVSVAFRPGNEVERLGGEVGQEAKTMSDVRSRDDPVLNLSAEGAV